jgi:hypothetical protein
MALSELLDRAEKAPKRHVDVEVIFDATTVTRLEELENERQQVLADLDQLDDDLLTELDGLQKDLRNSDPRPAKAKKAAEKQRKPLQDRADQLEAEIEDVNASVADSLVTFRFTALDGWEWQDITAHSVPRDGVAEDSGRPYNMDEVCKIAATRSGVILNRDTTSPVTAEEWERVWKIAPAPSLSAIKFRVWYLNEYQWDAIREAAMNAARKASGAKGRPVAALALRLGVAPRRLNGWEPSTTYTHVHNSEGRLVSTIVTREPEYSIDDVALLAAQAELEADIGPHGQPMSEATSGFADPNLRGTRATGTSGLHHRLRGEEMRAGAGTAASEGVPRRQDPRASCVDGVRRWRRPR